MPSTRAVSIERPSGEVDGGLEDLGAALAIAEEVGIVDDIGRAYANRAWVLDVAGRLEEAVELAEIGDRDRRSASA